MKEKLLPVIRQDYPNLDGLSQEEAQTVMDDFLDHWQYVIDENERRFSRALHRMRLCAFLHGFSGTHLGEDRHYSWCPAPHWYKEFDSEDLMQPGSDYPEI